MAPRRLGKTDLYLSPIGFGAFKIGRNEGHKYPQPYALPDVDAVDRLLNGVLDLGIRYIDTAPAYGISEERIGQSIAHRRNEFVLSTKVGETFEDGRSTYDFSERSIRFSVERSLQRLRTGVIDLVYIHAHSEDEAILRDTDAVATLVSLKQQGLVRAIGLSGKTVAAAQMALEWADALMVEYHVHDRSHEAVVGEAARRGVGVTVKKGLGSGRLPPEDAIPFVLRNHAVASLIIGGLDLAHLRRNVELAADVPMDAATIDPV